MRQKINRKTQKPSWKSLLGILTAFLIGVNGLAWEMEPIIFCQATGNQAFVRMVQDDKDGVYLAWQDKRNGNMDIYAQYYSHGDKERWGKDGVPVCIDPQRQQYPLIIPGDQGSLLILWQDSRSGDNALYMQKLSVDGKPLWPINGKLTAKVRVPITYPAITEDGQGGIVFIWQDGQGSQSGIYAMRVAADGTHPWGKTPLWIGPTGPESGKPCIINDTQGGVIIIWQYRTEELNQIRAQKLTSQGKLGWGGGGLIIKDIFNEIAEIQALSDGQGGVILTWEDATNFYYGVYAQRLSSEGKYLWNPKGVLVGSDPELLYAPQVISDSRGGIIMIWQMEDLQKINNRLYAQRVDSKGNTIWQKNGVTVCQLSKLDILNPLMKPDGQGGVLIIWNDSRMGINDIYIQRLDSKGKPAWESNGRVLCNAPSHQMYPQIAITSRQEAYMAWWDLRSQKDMNIIGAWINLSNSAGSGNLGDKSAATQP